MTVVTVTTTIAKALTFVFFSFCLIRLCSSRRRRRTYAATCGKCVVLTVRL